MVLLRKPGLYPILGAALALGALAVQIATYCEMEHGQTDVILARRRLPYGVGLILS
jgi:hypothetical protein